MTAPKSLAHLRPRLESGLADLKLSASAQSVDRLIGYLELMVQWNEAYNLSAIRNPDDMLGKHILDSVVMAPHWQTDRLADMGSGAGLPGIPLSILFPDRHVHVIESNGKKARFMRECQRVLALPHLHVEQCRAEDFKPSSSVPSATARALAELSILCEWCRPWLAADGELLAMKGPAFESELQALPKDFRHERTETLAVPEIDGKRFLVVLRRTGV